MRELFISGILAILLSPIFYFENRTVLQSPPAPATFKLYLNDTDQRPIDPGSLWRLEGLREYQFLYIDSSLHLYFINDVTAPLVKPFNYESHTNDQFKFVNKNLDEQSYGVVQLTINGYGEIQRCFYSRFKKETDELVKTWDFMASFIDVACCSNHTPRHCCKGLQQMSDTTRKYKCVWP